MRLVIGSARRVRFVVSRSAGVELATVSVLISRPPRLWCSGDAATTWDPRWYTKPLRGQERGSVIPIVGSAGETSDSALARFDGPACFRSSAAISDPRDFAGFFKSQY